MYSSFKEQIYNNFYNLRPAFKHSIGIISQPTTTILPTFLETYIITTFTIPPLQVLPYPHQKKMPERVASYIKLNNSNAGNELKTNIMKNPVVF